METVNRKYTNDAKIAVLCGGLSSEKDVSMRSGKNVLAALQRLGYKNAELLVVDKDVANKLSEGKYDVAYNALHGKYGEDGCVQGILEILQIPYTGSGVMASSVCMNKEYTKRVLSTCKDIPLIKSVFVRKGEDVKEACKNLKYPIITKPVCEGSSFGMTKVNIPDELEAAYNEALKFNDDVLIEEFINGFFITVGVLGMSDFIVPSTALSAEKTKEIKEIAVKAHECAGCSGVSRIDFMVMDNKPYFLEINTSPGMTDTSDLPAQSAVMGIDYDNLVLTILNSAGINK